MGIEWIVLGGIGLTAEAISNHDRNIQLQRHDNFFRSIVIDKDLESSLADKIKSKENYNDIWKRIEEFKRDNPAAVVVDKTNCWEEVGERRFKIHYQQGEKHTKEQDMAHNAAFIMTLDLLCVTYGGHSQSHAMRIANAKFPVRG